MCTSTARTTKRVNGSDESLGQCTEMMGNRTNNHVREPCLFVGCLTSQQHASISQRRICSDKFTYCHTEIEVADQTFYLAESLY